MPKSAKHEQDDKRRRRTGKRAKWIQQRTKHAVQYYSTAKKQDLQDAKVRYLLKLGIKDPFAKSVEAGTERSAPINDSFEELPAAYGLRKSTLSKECSYEEQSLQSFSPQQPNHPVAAKSDSESSLGEEDQFQLKQAHLAALQVQKIIDNFLDFHSVHRAKRSVAREQLVNFLRTTKYCLNCEKYLSLLLGYNKRLYSCEDGRIACRSISSQERDQREEDTRSRMRRKRVGSAVLMLN